MWGGAEIHVDALYHELRRRGYVVEVLRVPFTWMPKTEIVKNCLAWRLITPTARGGEPVDLVIATKFPSYCVQHPNKVTWLLHQFREAYDLYGTPYSIFDDTPEDDRIRQLIYHIDNTILPESRRIFTNAQNTANRLAKYNGVHGEALYHPPKHVGRYRHEQYGGYIFTAGRLELLKRNDLLLQAMARVQTPVKCLIAGEGRDRERLERMAEELGIADRVRFLGFVSDEQLLDLYANALAVYYAPLDEDYGYITLEGFFSRKPVLTLHDAGGPLEFVRHDENGYVIYNGPEEIAGHIDQLYADRALCAELGERGYQTVKDISWDHVVEALLSA